MFANKICRNFKMNIIFILTLVFTFDLSVASGLRENLNVLVPNNDVNLHAKIKTLLSGDEVDPEDFSDSEKESLAQMKDPDIEKLRHKEMKAKLIEKEENNELEQEMSLSGLKKTISGLIDNSHLITPPNFSETVLLKLVTSNYTEDLTTPYQTTPQQTSSNPTSSNNTWTSTMASNTTTNRWTTNSTTPSYTTSNYTSTTNWTDITIPGNTTLTVSTNTTQRTTEESTQNFTMSTGFFNETTMFETTDNQTEATSPQTISTLPDDPNTPEYPIFSPVHASECLLGRAARYLSWLNGEGGLNVEYIIGEFGTVNHTDLSRRFYDMHDYEEFVNNSVMANNTSNVRLLSASYNNFSRLPFELLAWSRMTLEYLSLAGNVLKRIDGFEHLPSLKVLDLRRSQIEILTNECFKMLPNLQQLYLAENEICIISQNIFPPKLIHLDLSYNFHQDNPEGLLIDNHAFKELNRLQRLDLSFTKICETRDFDPLKNLTNLNGLSLCSTDLSGDMETVFNHSTKLKYLDISGNARVVLNEKIFASFSNSLQVLFARNLSRQDLDWTKPLTNLRILDLYNSNIHEVFSDSFSHMTYLTTLNLEKNAIGNWYSKIFSENQHLETLNLRDNKLTILKEDMMEDFLSVQFLAIGKNGFECTCVLQEFMKLVFEATKSGNVTRYLSDKETEIIDDTDEIEFTDTTRVSLGVRNYLRPEYDVMSRTYQKYYQMAAQSVQAMKIRTSIASASDSKTIVQKKLIMISKVLEGHTDEEFQTILFDYDEDFDDYKCWNATGKMLQEIIDMQNLCENDSREPVEPPYQDEKRNALIALYISFPAVIIVSVLLLVIYWKWWYIKYFFVLCKNSAILTFMDDSNGDKETIIKENNSESVDVFLYDAFVSYCEQNREWVLDEFIPNVERRESINVCLHERDFQVGYGILENIVSCMDRSRCLLLLISSNFLQSQWCQFEMNLAQHRLLETRREKLILVLLEDIPVKKQPKTLKYLMRTKTYIKWPQNGSADEKALFWKRLKKAIISSKWETSSYGSIA